MIPMPPSHWVNWRQRSSEWSTLSMLVRIVAPVVVKPDIDSKNASTGPSSCGSPERRYGMRAEAAAMQPRQRDDEVALAEPDRRASATPRRSSAKPAAKAIAPGGQERPGRLAVAEAATALGRAPRR